MRAKVKHPFVRVSGCPNRLGSQSVWEFWSDENISINCDGQFQN
jgi:hypothetical protein